MTEPGPNTLGVRVRQQIAAHLPSLGRQALALGIGFLGAQVFLWAQMPLAWMLGAMTATAVAAVLNLPIEHPRLLRTCMVPIIGVSLGSAFSPDSLAALAHMGIGLMVLLLGILVAALLCYSFYTRIGKLDQKTAIFSSMPGGLAEMVILSEGHDIDTGKVALMQAARVFAVVMIVPLWFRFSEGLTYSSGQNPLAISFSVASWSSLAITAVYAAIGAAIAVRLRLPAAVLIGPLFLCAGSQLLDITNIRPVYELIAFAQLALGTSVGARLKLATGREALNLLGLGFIGAAIMIIIAATAAFLVADFVSIPQNEVLLSFAPGGIAEMALMALALGVDVTVVVSVQVARIAMVILLARIMLRMIAPRD